MDNATDLQKGEETRSRVRILGVDLDQAGMADVLERLDGFVREGKPRQVVTVNLQFVSEARNNPVFAQLINNADLAVADGMPLIWVSKLLGAPIAARITGHDLLSECAALAHEQGYSMYLLGGGSGAAKDAASRLRTMYPGLKIAGNHHGRFFNSGEAERQEELINTVRDLRPDFLFVALGCPKQELFVRRYMHALQVPVCVGIGGTLDVFTGHWKRAPEWMQHRGLEWVYRLAQDPGRLWKRYLLNDAPTTLRAVGSAVLQRASTLRG